MDAISFREAKSSDAAALGVLHVTSWHETYAGIKLGDRYVPVTATLRFGLECRRPQRDRHPRYRIKLGDRYVPVTATLLVTGTYLSCLKVLVTGTYLSPNGAHGLHVRSAML